jgi:hypothetical protein
LGKKGFFTPRYPAEPTKEMGYVEIDEKIVQRIGIRSIYNANSYGGQAEVVGPDGIRFTAYCDNPNGFGGRNKRRFILHTLPDWVLGLALTFYF